MHAVFTKSTKLKSLKNEPTNEEINKRTNEGQAQVQSKALRSYLYIYPESCDLNALANSLYETCQHGIMVVVIEANIQSNVTNTACYSETFKFRFLVCFPLFSFN